MHNTKKAGRTFMYEEYLESEDKADAKVSQAGRGTAGFPFRYPNLVSVQSPDYHDSAGICTNHVVIHPSIRSFVHVRPI